jgi:hypothetical protein
MAYPTDPVAFVEVAPGENRTDVATMLGAEVTAIETALLHPAAQTAAPIRMRGGGNQIEWGPAAAGRLSVLGSTNGRSFIGLGCEAGSTPGTYTTRAQKGIVLTTDGASGLLVQAVQQPGLANQTPVTRFSVPKSGFPLLSNPVLGSWGIGAMSVPNNTDTYLSGVSTSSDAYGFLVGPGDWKVPVGMAGWYLWICSLTWAANATGNRCAQFYNIPTAFATRDWRVCDQDGGTFAHQVVLMRQMADAEALNVILRQTSGVTLTASVNVRMLRLF